MGTVAGVSPDVESMRVQRNDFLAALEEVKPAFGVSDEDLISCIQNKIIHYDLHVEVFLTFFFINTHIYINMLEYII